MSTTAQTPIEAEAFFFSKDRSEILRRLWGANPALHRALCTAETLEEARTAVRRTLVEAEEKTMAADCALHALERANLGVAVDVLRDIVAPLYEARTGNSALELLWKIARGREHELAEPVSIGFLLEFFHLFLAIDGRAQVYVDEEGRPLDRPDYLELEGRAAAERRMVALDHLASYAERRMQRFPSGLEPDAVARRAERRERILDYFGGGEEDWEDYRWHLIHVIKDARTLGDLVDLPAEQLDVVRRATQDRIPFGITPYYVSLMDPEPSQNGDHAIRAQVLPPLDYVDQLESSRDERRLASDFMGEAETSPVNLVTRRYPKIAILKPFNTCAQICVYCQRNWEIDQCMAPDAAASTADIDRALEWFVAHPHVDEILITGGDPLVQSNRWLERLLDKVAALEHIYRIRVGTRTPVVLPSRWTEETVALLGKYHEPGRRQVCVVTHFAHPYEITPDAQLAVDRIRRAGMLVYNQQVFTINNARRFETAKLRRVLKSIGVDPYYTFNLKGKEETRSMRVPIARLLQERKEEARLLPGADRTDEPVFNVPRLGKNHLRARQDHRIVMIQADGSRVYEFHPWEKYIADIPPYYFTDVPIYDFLNELERRGEAIRDYWRIWYYY